MAKKAQDDRVFIQNAVKTLATNIRFASVDNPVRSIVVTSSIPNEGKTTIATNLAQALGLRRQERAHRGVRHAPPLPCGRPGHPCPQWHLRRALRPG